MMMSSKPNGTLYIGVTSDLVKRVWEHKNNQADGFTKKYGVHTLVWYEQHEAMESAIVREKQIKKWNRQWKIQLINEFNPTWRDLYSEILWKMDSRFRENDILEWVILIEINYPSGGSGFIHTIDLEISIGWYEQ